MQKNLLRLSVLAMLTVLLCLSPIVAASQTTQGYVNYQITLSSSSTTSSLTIRESVSPSSSSGFSLLTLELMGAQQNLTYSRLVNSSFPLLFPYMIYPANNQSISYQTRNYSINLSVTQIGSSSVTFNGSSYKLTEYTFWASVSFENSTTKTVSGSLNTFPSSLIYSAQLAVNGTTAEIQLLSTNLALDPQASGSMTQTEAIAMSGIGAAGLAITAFVGVKRFGRRKHESVQSDTKPSYWVD